MLLSLWLATFGAPLPLAPTRTSNGDGAGESRGLSRPAGACNCCCQSADCACGCAENATRAETASTAGPTIKACTCSAHGSAWIGGGLVAVPAPAFRVSAFWRAMHRAVDQTTTSMLTATLIPPVPPPRA